MKLKDMEFADCPVIQTYYHEKCVEVVFEELFDIEKNAFYQNGKLLIEQWKFTEGKKIQSDGPGVGCYEEILNYPYSFNFSLIQDIILDENKLTLKGFSIEPGFWLEYSFIDAKCTLSF